VAFPALQDPSSVWEIDGDRVLGGGPRVHAEPSMRIRVEVLAFI
jgi:hypothetical protein